MGNVKTFLIIISLIFATHTAQAEINYNVNDVEHKADKECIAIMSIWRDTFVVMGKDLTHPLYVEITDYQNQLILKYAYSKQLNTHVETWKTLLTQRFDEGKWTPTKTELIDCIDRI